LFLKLSPEDSTLASPKILEPLAERIAIWIDRAIILSADKAKTRASWLPVPRYDGATRCDWV